MKTKYKCKRCNKVWTEDQLLEDPDTGKVSCGDVNCTGQGFDIQPITDTKNCHAKRRQKEKDEWTN